MAVNSARQDELQKEVPKRDTLIRMFRYLLDYKRTIAFVSVLIRTGGDAGGAVDDRAGR